MWSGYDRGSGKLDAASNSQQETLADIEHISTIAGSLGSIGTISQSGDGEPVYETDHTDLNSEYDEVELRRELMKDFDPEGFGEIPVDDFVAALKSPEFLANVPPNKRDILYDRALKAKTSKVEAISFQDFVNVPQRCAAMGERPGVLAAIGNARQHALVP
uniref:EF-hand domain-containing protein n=1 Tax=Anopheles melas TaxID=34690 RepID=A0A182UDB3_9DIPT